MKKTLALFILMAGAACTSPTSKWHLVLKHDGGGQVLAGSETELVSAIRLGCELRVAWGARRRADPNSTIEHVASPVWVSVRDGDTVEVQLGDFLINLPVLGEPAADHPTRGPYGGVERAVMWRATLKTDGTFDAVWYDQATGDFITRVPQRHPMSWYADCQPAAATPLYPDAALE